MYKKNKHAGMTLIELVSALGVSALVIGGALAMYDAASTTHISEQLANDVNSFRVSIKALHSASSGYGATSLNDLLIASKKLPTTFLSFGSTINHGSLGGTVSAVGNTSNFTITVTLIPKEVCISLLPQSSGFLSVKVDARAAITTFPISPATAMAECLLTTSTVVYTSI